MLQFLSLKQTTQVFEIKTTNSRIQAYCSSSINSYTFLDGLINFLASKHNVENEWNEVQRANS